MEPPSDQRLVNLLGALAVGLSDAARQGAERASGLTGAGPSALVVLLQSLSGGSMDDLRRAVGLTPSGAVRLVDRLVADGLVERRRGSDQRSLSLVLTRSGRSAARRVLAARAASVTAALGELDGPARAALEPLAERLVAAVTAQRLAQRADAASSSPNGWLCRLCDHAACGRPDGRCPAAAAAAGRYDAQ